MRKLIGLTLASLLVFTFTDWSTASAESADDLKKQIENLEQEQQELTELESEIENEKSDTEKKKQENLEKQGVVNNDINSIDNQLTQTLADIEAKEVDINKTNNEIDDLNEKIKELEGQIDELKVEIQDLETTIAKREELLKDRLRSVQKSGGKLKYLEVLLGSKSFSDFISRTAAVTTLMDQDKNLMEQLKVDKKAVEDKKEKVEKSKKEVQSNKTEVENKKLALEAQKQELVALKGQLNLQMAQKEKLLAELKSEQQILHEIELSLEEEQKIIAAERAAKEKAKAMAERKLDQLSQPQTPPQTGNPNGIFIHPANGRITSPFGNRWHPIFNTYHLHAGTDFAVPTGTSLLAPADGVVSRAEYVGGFGNVIFISHYINGQSYTTVSAHLSVIGVSAGQEVKQGQVIGQTGNTGDSTGPHLHFEVHPGGYKNPVNPLPYFK